MKLYLVKGTHHTSSRFHVSDMNWDNNKNSYIYIYTFISEKKIYICAIYKPIQ